MVFDKINEALEKLGDLGKLIEIPLQNAYGVTDKKNRVWLPFVPQNDSHENFIYAEGREYILQIDDNRTSKDPDMEIVHVITRKKIDDNTTDYNYIGKYQQILFDREKKLSVYVKVKVYKEQDEQDKQKELFWNDAFFSSAKEAQEKAEEFLKITNRKRYI